MGFKCGRLSPAMVNLLRLCIGIILHSLSFQSVAHASPFDQRSGPDSNLIKRYIGSPAGKLYTGGPNVSDYPSDDEIKAAFFHRHGPYLFFENIQVVGPNGQETSWAERNLGSKNILRESFPKGYLNRRYKSGPSRSYQWYQDFIDRASGHFADKAVEAGNEVFFIGQRDDEVLDCSIWKRIELPTLIAGNISITLVDVNWGTTRDYFAPPDPPTPDFIETTDPPSPDGIERRALEKRRTRFCFDWNGKDQDENDPGVTYDNEPPPGQNYYEGTCRLHLWQYLKNQGPWSTDYRLTERSSYRISVKIYDDNGQLIEEAEHINAPGGWPVWPNGDLAPAFSVTAHDEDDDPISFEYSGYQKWDSNSKQCTVGEYIGVSRQIYCNFTC